MSSKLLIFSTVLLFVINASSVVAQTYSTSFTKGDNTYVVTKTISGGMVTIETKIYNSAGQLIDTKTTTKTAQPSPVKQMEINPSIYPTKPLLPPATPLPTKPMVTPPVEVTLPKELDVTTTAPVITVTKELITTKAQNWGVKQVGQVRLIEIDGQLQYQVEGKKQARLLSIINLNLPVKLEYNAANGNLTKVDQPSWVKVVELISR